MESDLAVSSVKLASREAKGEGAHNTYTEPEYLLGLA